MFRMRHAACALAALTPHFVARHAVLGWCGEFEIPATFAASPWQEFQIHKPH
jgi:hypothetical protein